MPNLVSSSLYAIGKDKKQWCPYVTIEGIQVLIEWVLTRKRIETIDITILDSKALY
jgi:hypothetical protein